jgi:prepilin-type N-terminal cleavage/methylation domain-containing protein
MKRVGATPRTDRGFTLPEVMISVMIIAVIATVMVGVASVVLRNTPTTEARAEDARSMLGLVTWLPQDVDSTPPTGFVVDPSAQSGCSATPDTGTNLLRLQWTERASSTTVTYIANYRSVPNSSSRSHIERITCSGSGGAFSNVMRLSMTAELPALPPGWTQGSAPAEVHVDTVSGPIPLVIFKLTTIDGDVVYADSAPKNPAMTLPATTLPSWKPPTPTTGVTVETAPTTTNISFTIYPNVATNANLIVYDADGDSLQVELVPSSIPAGWTVTLLGVALSVTAPTGTPANVPYVISYTVDDHRGGVVTGTVTVTVINPATSSTTTSTTSTSSTSTSTTTTLPPVCLVTGRSVSPASVKNVQTDSHNQGGGNVTVGVLLDPVVVTATTNEHCEGLQIQYNSGGFNSPPFRAMTQTSATTWSVTLESRSMGSSETWSDGIHALAFHSANGGSWGTVNLEVK